MIIAIKLSRISIYIYIHVLFWIAAILHPSHHPTTKQPCFIEIPSPSDLTTGAEVAVTCGVIGVMRSTIVAFLLFGPVAPLVGVDDKAGGVAVANTMIMSKS